MSRFSQIGQVHLSALLLVCLGVFPHTLWALQADQAKAPAASPTPSLPPQEVSAEQLGDSMVAQQHYQEAIAQYAKAPKMSAALWNKLGIAYQMMFDAKDAMRCYKQSLKLEPDSSRVLNNLGTLYTSLKEYGHADRMYRMSLKLDPQSATTFKNLGTNLLAQHKYAKGYEAYKHAAAIDPQIFTDHTGPMVENPSNVQERGAMNYYMALGCASAGHIDCAIEYLRKALDEGFVTAKKIASDAEFADLRSNPAFKELIAGQQGQ